MKVSKEDVKHIALLARIDIPNQELTDYQSHLSQVLEYMEELKEVNTDGIEPLFSPAFLNEVSIEEAAREDQVVEGLTPDELLVNAPRHKQNQFLVEAVIEDNE